MNCGNKFGGGQGYVDVCGDNVGYGRENEKIVCGKCRDKLMLKMALHIDIDIFEKDEREFISRLLTKER